jgi:hypothetical protein
MADLLFIAVTIAFFGLALVLVRACDRIIGPDPDPQPASEAGSEVASEPGSEPSRGDSVSVPAGATAGEVEA